MSKCTECLFDCPDRLFNFDQIKMEHLEEILRNSRWGKFSKKILATFQVDFEKTLTTGENIFT